MPMRMCLFPYEAPTRSARRSHSGLAFRERHRQGYERPNDHARRVRQFAFRDRQLQTVQSLDQQPHRHLDLHPGKHGSDATMYPAAECQMLPSIFPLQAEAVGVIKLCRVTVVGGITEVDE